MRKVYVLLLVLALVLACDLRGSYIPINNAAIFGHGVIGGANQVQENEKTGKSASIKKLPTIPANEDKSYADITARLSDWRVEGEGVSIMDGFLEISNAKGRGDSWMVSPRLSTPGSYKMVAMVKSENVIGGNKNYERGKFQIVVFENGKEKDWPDDDFDGTFDWQQKSVEVHNISGSESIAFRIGLQHASGKILVRDIHIFYKP